MILSSAFEISLPYLVSGVLAAIVYAVLALFAHRLSTQLAKLILGLAWLLHILMLSLGLGLDFGAILGSIWMSNSAARFGFAPALSITAWLVLTVYAIEIHLMPKMQARWALAGLGSMTIVLALWFPGRELPPATLMWQPLHWALGIASYGLFTAAVVHAGLMTHAEQRIRQGNDPLSGIPLLMLERLTFRFVTAGFVLLSATLLAGLFFAEFSANASGWRWSHKMLFSLLSWIVFAILLVGRMRFGWRGKLAVRMLYLGAILLLLAYVGSRFVLEVLLQRSIY